MTCYSRMRVYFKRMDRILMESPDSVMRAKTLRENRAKAKRVKLLLKKDQLDTL